MPMDATWPCVSVPVWGDGSRFDENLPLYGWLEDVDFCRQLARYGRIVKNIRLIGVHLGSKGDAEPAEFGSDTLQIPPIRSILA